MIKKVLITNDDGINSPSLLRLQREFEKTFETYVIAPDNQKSGTSMAFQYNSEFDVTNISTNKYSVDGYPVDCVDVGLYSKLIPEVDLIVSGINLGLNVGHDIYYSGTIGAAKHASLAGKYSIAVSSEKVEMNSDFSMECSFIARYVQKYQKELKKDVVYNFNLPKQFHHSIENIKITKPQKIVYVNNFKIQKIDEKRNKFYSNRSKENHKFSLLQDGDFSTLQNGEISLSLLSLEEFKN